MFILLVLASTASGFVVRTDNYNVETNEVLATKDIRLATFPDLIVDFALAEIRHRLKDLNDTTIEIDDIDLSFSRSWLGIPLKGKLHTSHGTFRNPSTIIRKSPTSVRNVNDTIVFSFTVSFSEMEISYDKIHILLFGINEYGKADVQINSNSIELSISVRFLPECEVKLSTIKITQLSEVATRVTGLSVLDPMVDYIVSLIVVHFRSSFTAHIESLIKAKIQKMLPHTSFCKVQYYN